MKYVLIMLFVTFAATKALAQAKNFYPVGKEGAKTTYIDNQVLCELSEGVDCYDITKCPPDECKVVGGKLKTDQAMKNEKLARIEAELEEERQKDQAKKSRKTRILAQCSNETGLIKDLCDELVGR